MSVQHLDARRGQVLAEREMPLAASPTSVPLAHPEQPLPPGSHLRLRFELHPRARAFLGVHRVLPRSLVIERCKGLGVEIGPGSNPQIRASPEVDVTYVEQSAPEQWQALYNAKGKYRVEPRLWQRYVIGEAYPLPAQDGSLDFIFSSHVLEHLANPLGHLQHWAGKLKHGGIVAAIVPDARGSKDYVFDLTDPDEILEEYRAGRMQPELRHYERWGRYRAPGRDPRGELAAGRSIHVHFYSRCNMQALLELAVERAGYDSFEIHHTPNHKDFYFVLRR